MKTHLASRFPSSLLLLLSTKDNQSLFTIGVLSASSVETEPALHGKTASKIQREAMPPQPPSYIKGAVNFLFSRLLLLRSVFSPLK